MCLECGPLIKAIDAYIEKADEDLEKQLGAEGYAEPKRTLEYAQDIEDGVADALNEENDEIVSAAEKAEDLNAFAQDVWPGMKESDAVDEKLSSVFKRNFEKFMPEFVDYYIQQTDRKLKLEQVSKRTTAWVGSWSEELGKLMKLNSHLEIEAILQKGLQDGKGVAEFTRQILDSGIRDTYYKARRVAVTEVLRAHSVAQQESFMQSPSVSEKMWKHTGSYRNQPRQNHVDMDGQRVAKDAMFTLIGIKGGILQCMYPRDPSLPPEESINCHCICQPVVDEGILGMSLEERQKLQQQAIDEMDDEWEKELDARNRAKAGIEQQPATAGNFRKESFAGGKGDFELTGDVADLHLTSTARKRIEEATEQIQSAADLEKYLGERGIKLETSSEALKKRWKDNIPNVKQQMDYVVAAVEQYDELGGLSNLRAVHIWERDLDVQAQYIYRAIGEGPVPDEGHLFISDRANGFQVMHEFAHAFADSTKPSGMDVVKWSEALNINAGLSADATAYFGASQDVIGAEKFADAIGSAIAYGKEENLEFLANVANVIQNQGNIPKSFPDLITKIKDEIAASGGTVTEHYLLKAGGVVEDELKVNRQPLREKYEKAKTVREAADAETLKRNDELVALWDKYDSATTAEERMALKPSLDRAAEAADDARNKSLNAIIDEKDAYFKYKGSGAENAKELKEKLAEIREMGVVGHDLKKEHFIGRGSMRSVVEEAYNHYPREWVDKSVDEGGLRVKKTRRGYYAHSAKEIAISGNGFSTATHELGHRFERVVDGIREAEQEFYDRRTAGEALEWLGKPYEKNETTRKDKFLDPYMGKDYGGSAYELVSMGFAMAFNDPVSLWDDEEYAKWIYGILSLM